MKNNNRRSALKKIVGSTALLSTGIGLNQAMAASKSVLGADLHGKINHSICRWCYKEIELEDLCKAAVRIGIPSIELTGPEEWPLLKKYNLTSGLPWGAGKGIKDGWNNPEFHDELIADFESIFPKLKAAGLDKIITFSGNRNGLSEEQGLANCAMGLKRLMPAAEKHGITVVMELLNSKVNHPDYQCDTTPWGAALCDAVGSENFKLLYDIYHMQIMEGDVIATIKKYQKYIAHYHTGGVPGRNEIDDSQELNYPAIMKAIVETGYKGFVGQEFRPTRDPLTSLEQAVKICDVA